MKFSNFVTNQKMDFQNILDDFRCWLIEQDGSTFSFEDSKELKELYDKNPIIGILCAAMQDTGYDSF